MRHCRLSCTVLAIIIARATLLGAQGSDLSLSPFVSFFPGSGTSTVGGLGLTLAGGPKFGLRAAGRVAFKNTYAGPIGAESWLPPWGADVDAVMGLTGRPFGGRNRSPSTFVFLGLGASARDTADVRLIAKNWSYGIGTMLPLGPVVDLFAESRWRIAQLVLPTATPKPARSKELRFGISFHR